MSRRISDTAFEHFWAQYPRKVGKLAAQREWELIRPTPELVEQMMATLAWQKEQWDDPQFIPHPRTWLHQGRWLDEPVEQARPVTRTSARLPVWARDTA